MRTPPGDLSLSFLQFGAATALAGLRGGFSDLRTSYDFCSTSDSFCKSAPLLHSAAPRRTLLTPRSRLELVAASVFSYLAWLFTMPNLIVNIHGNERGPW